MAHQEFCCFEEEDVSPFAKVDVYPFILNSPRSKSGCLLTILGAFQMFLKEVLTFIPKAGSRLTSLETGSGLHEP